MLNTKKKKVEQISTYKNLGVENDDHLRLNECPGSKSKNYNRGCSVLGNQPDVPL